METTFGRSPEEIRDDLAIMLVEDFSDELTQLNLTLDDLLEMDHYEIEKVKRDVYAIVRSPSEIIRQIMRYDRWSRGY